MISGLSGARPGCPFCKDVGKCISICRNPQNVGNPEQGPLKTLSAPGSVATQLNALQNNSTPRYNHGLGVMYEFCGDVDAFERSRYFGMSKDIYAMVRHLRAAWLRTLALFDSLASRVLVQDHFQAAFVQSMPGLTDLKSYDVKRSKALPDGRVEVEVSVLGQHARDPAEARDYVFVMRRAVIGKHKGCWVTHRLLAADSQYRGVV